MDLEQISISKTVSSQEQSSCEDLGHWLLEFKICLGFSAIGGPAFG